MQGGTHVMSTQKLYELARKKSLPVLWVQRAWNILRGLNGGSPCSYGHFADSKLNFLNVLDFHFVWHLSFLIQRQHEQGKKKVSIFYVWMSTASRLFK